MAIGSDSRISFSLTKISQTTAAYPRNSGHCMASPLRDPGEDVVEPLVERRQLLLQRLGAAGRRLAGLRPVLATVPVEDEDGCDHGRDHDAAFPSLCSISATRAAVVFSAA